MTGTAILLAYPVPFQDRCPDVATLVSRVRCAVDMLEKSAFREQAC